MSRDIIIFCSPSVKKVVETHASMKMPHISTLLCLFFSCSAQNTAIFSLNHPQISHKFLFIHFVAVEIPLGEIISAFI